MKRVAIVGSGTDVGKTFVSCRLIEDLRARGLRVVPRKPVVSGVDDDDIGNSDTDRLIAAAGLDLGARDSVSPWRFKAPLAPNAAAREEGVVLDHGAVLEACNVDDDDVAERPIDLVVIETAGGVMSPLTDTTTQLDLVFDTCAPALLVVEGSYLGWISHTLTALTALAAHGIGIVGVVVNHGVTEPLHPFVGTVPTLLVDDREGICAAVWPTVG